MNEKSVFNAPYWAKGLLFAAAAGMAIVSFVLTKTYFESIAPTGLDSSSFCDINEFFNCDVTLSSPASSIFGIPISSFGGILGVLFCLTFLFKSTEGTLNILSKLNVVGGALLFLYSLIGLGGLCPLCTLYFALSIVVAILFHKFSNEMSIDPKVIASYAALSIAVTFAVYKSKPTDLSKNPEFVKSLIQEFDKLKEYGDPAIESPYKLASATDKFADAPLRLTFFSDYQCPYCKVLSNNTKKLVRRYKGKVNIQYFFYPLSSACNPSVTRAGHALACSAAYISVCQGPENFIEGHDYIFDNQEDLSEDWIESYAKSSNVAECIKKPETKEKVQKLIEAAKPYNVKGTPVILLNGRKMSMQPLDRMYIILDELLKRNGAK